jgi:threonine dehydrogenase-like Zn-dependent dehydrogenase
MANAGQTHATLSHAEALLEHIERGGNDPTFVITHRAALDEAPRMFETFLNKQDECLKVRQPRRASAARLVGYHG